MAFKGMAALAAATTLACAPAAAQTPTSPAETVWQLRSALNVAALGCRGPEEAATVAGYNALLAGERAQLAEALAALSGEYQARHGAAWQARFDDDMTRAYNHWAQPTAHDGFCAEAGAVLREVASVEPSDFAAFAAAAVIRLEAPFHPAPVQMASAEPAASVEVATTEAAPAAAVVLAAILP